MKKRMVPISCPHCGHSFSILKDTYLLREPSSVEFQRMMDGTFFTHICSSCRKAYYLMYPLVYRDRTHGITLLLTDAKHVEGFEGPVLVCRSPLQFLNAFMMTEYRLDYAKTLRVLKQAGGRIRAGSRITGYDPDRHCLYVSTDSGEAAILIQSGQIVE